MNNKVWILFCLLLFLNDPVYCDINWVTTPYTYTDIRPTVVMQSRYSSVISAVEAAYPDFDLKQANMQAIHLYTPFSAPRRISVLRHLGEDDDDDDEPDPGFWHEPGEVVEEDTPLGNIPFVLLLICSATYITLKNKGRMQKS